ncbi:MAG TPA: ABC transporter permease [Terriglobales bacterium]|nr:ABC transporter permease [Terriglobales bacterium]
MSGMGLLENTLHDFKYGLRSMGKTPGFTLAVVLTAALGIGANTAMFSVIRGVLLKPLAYRDSARVVLLADGATPIRFHDFLRGAHSYTEVGAYAVTAEQMALSGIGQPEVLSAARVSANFLHILGVDPLLGRSFLPEEDKVGGPAVAMISAELWQRRFGGSPSVVGKSAALAGMPYTIIGVLPPRFQFPFPRTDVWVTQPSELSVIPAYGRQVSPILGVFGRLQGHISVGQATAELAVLNRRYRGAHPDMLDAKANAPDKVLPVKDDLVSDVRSKLWMLSGAVGLVLLIVCANLAGLLLARATSRTREFAVRVAIGAGRRRLVAQLLAESTLLGCLGGGLGILLAAWGAKAIRGISLDELPRAGDIHMDGWVLGFAVALSLLTSVLFGLAPALSAAGADLASVLRGSGEGQALQPPRPGLLRFSPRGLLVVGQVALSMVLLIGAALLMESISRLSRVDPGFDPRHLLTMNISPLPTHYDTDPKKEVFYQRLVERLQSLPGVGSAAVVTTLPADSWYGTTAQVVGRPPVELNQRPIVIFQDITPGYFTTMKIGLKRGRDFSWHDNEESTRVAVISEALARTFWPEYPQGPDPVGQHIQAGSSPQGYEIVGIAADIRQSRDAAPRAELYFPCLQKPPETAMIAVRTVGQPLALAGAVRNQILAMDRDQPVSGVSTMEKLMEDSEGQLRLIMTLLAIFAGVATLLAVIGLYGAISYSVAQRSKEIGIRRAVGAQPSDIVGLVLGQGLRLALAGVALGLGGAWALTRVMRDLLFQVSALDPATFIAVALTFVAVALLASYVPARRATAIDPLAALRAG